ncbi:hypothetical protein OTU49_011201 [Cherax quadricarinatus]|uniref:Uncharacterized protein n=1 Tax=Cherax quadricarinatus TaxID=27406 RepID=A0AAW0YJV9_CHEQU
MLSKGGVVYGCFLLLGLGTLLPWNFFITAQTYWDFKFRNTSHTNETMSEPTELQRLYTPMQVCFSQIPNFVFLFINALFSHKLPQRLRLLVSLTLMIILFALTTILTQINTDDWQKGFFILTILIIILINSSGAIFQCGLFGVAGMFPEKYMTAVVAGQALGGVFASGARIVSLSVGAKDENAAFIYFMIAVVVMILTLTAYLYMSKTPQRGSKILYIMVLLRVVFIPLFLLCNHNPNSAIPTVFGHDAWYVVFMLLFSLSNGYCSSLCMMYGPKMVSEDKAEVASSMMAAMLGLGLLTGGLSSFAFALIG